ncbi:MAG: peptide methionine sulfoxide reductase msrA/msrB [Saprospiraceae bacterium]|jgi:peptide methionine sulfoxide reductase msrA/msrB
MRILLGLLIIFGIVACSSQAQNTNTLHKGKTMDEKNWKLLSNEETRVIINKGTEYPFTGEYNDNKENGVYQCKQCHVSLFSSKDKFDSGSGWPSFDDAIEGAVKEIVDADGKRSEIVCANCEGHLGHVFKGEEMTSKSTRHCVNSISLEFMPDESNVKKDTAYFASGCFWGTEYYLQQLEGVLSTDVGYMGGHVKNPSYKEVCTGKTGHAEVVKVVFAPDSVSYKDLAKLFFETHDPTQVNRQGPDIGTQYRSEVFYTSESQKEIAAELVAELSIKGLVIATKITEAPVFWKGETYHQDYYQGNGGRPYCHSYQKKF